MEEFRRIIELPYGAAKVRGVRSDRVRLNTTAHLVMYQDISGGSDEAYAPAQQVEVYGPDAIRKLRDLLTRLLNYLDSNERTKNDDTQQTALDSPDMS